MRINYLSFGLALFRTNRKRVRGTVQKVFLQFGKLKFRYTLALLNNCSMNLIPFIPCHLLIKQLRKAIHNGWLCKIEIGACLITGNKTDFNQIALA